MPTGEWNRKQFAESTNLLRSLGLSPGAIEHYRRLARATRRLPHDLVIEIAEEAAAHPNEAVRSLLYFHLGTGTGGI
jgi:EAL domain-containing protein (putative c-di-GMP-specific phosphodiesterase class I)